MQKRTLRGCMKRAQQRIGNRLRTVLTLIKSKLPEWLVERLEELYEDISIHPELSCFTIGSLAWGVYEVFFDLRSAISRRLRTFRKRLQRVEEYPAQSCFQPKASGLIRRHLFSIHTQIRNKKYKKRVSEKGLPDGFHYRIEGLRVRGGALLMMEGICHKVEDGSYIHIESEAGVKFVFDIDTHDRIAGDRHAIPDDDYMQIIIWLWRHGGELSFEWATYASPIVGWPEWNVFDRYTTYLERRQMQARLRAELLLPSSKYRRG